MSVSPVLSLIDRVVEELKYDSHSASAIVRRSNTVRELCEKEGPRDTLFAVFERYKSIGFPNPDTLEHHVQYGLALLMVRLLGVLKIHNQGVDLSDRQAVIEWIDKICNFLRK